MYDVLNTLNTLKTHIQSTGLFEAVSAAEPVTSPNVGMHVAVWTQDIVPMPEASGLDTTTGRLMFFVRLYASVTGGVNSEEIEASLVNATMALLTAYSGDFTLGGLIRNVDLLGESGESLSSEAGYLEFSDGGFFRVMTITLPLVINDLWSQEA